MDTFDKMLTVGVTGHRPDKLGGYSQEVKDRLREFAKMQLQAIQPAQVITGMALGWDQAVAQACVDLGYSWWAFIPFAGQERKWPAETQSYYHDLLSKATGVKTICEGEYAPWKMIKRDEAVVQSCWILLALYNGTPGGTHKTVEFAKELRRITHNCWEPWLRYNFRLKGDYNVPRLGVDNQELQNQELQEQDDGIFQLE